MFAPTLVNKHAHISKGTVWSTEHGTEIYVGCVKTMSLLPVCFYMGHFRICTSTCKMGPVFMY